MSANSSPRIGFIEGRAAGVSGASATAPAILKVAPVKASDASLLVSTIAEAFARDPTWSWAFPQPEARKRWWELCVDGALRYPWCLASEGFEAASVWIPPGGTEFPEETISRIPGLLQELTGARSADVAQLLDRFDQAHPRHEPHYYLSLLATADKHRGHGLGLALLGENLARIDAERMPAYLESSNPANNHRYESYGFEAVARFQAPGGGPEVTGMWRKAR